MLVLGIDPSAKKIAIVGYESFTNSYVVESKMLYPKGTTRQTPESLAIAQLWLESVIIAISSLAPIGQRYAYVEKPVVGRGGILATIKQAYVGGIIRGCLAKNGFEVYDANPSTWRSVLGIKGKGTVVLKALTRIHVQTNMPKAMIRLGTDVDLIDAAAICLYGGIQLRDGRTAEPAKRTVSKRKKS